MTCNENDKLINKTKQKYINSIHTTRFAFDDSHKSDRKTQNGYNSSRRNSDVMSTMTTQIHMKMNAMLRTSLRGKARKFFFSNLKKKDQNSNSTMKDILGKFVTLVITP